MATQADALLVHVLADEFRTHLIALRRLMADFEDDPTRTGLLRDARQRTHTIAASAFVLGEELLGKAGQAAERAFDHMMSHADDRVVLAALFAGLEDLEYLIQAMVEGSSGSRVAQQRGSEAVDRLTSVMSIVELPTIDGEPTALVEERGPWLETSGRIVTGGEITISKEPDEVEPTLVSSLDEPGQGALLRAETQRLLVAAHEQVEILLASPDDDRAVGDLCASLDAIASAAEIFGQPLLASAAIGLFAATNSVAAEPEALSAMLDDISGSLSHIERNLEAWCRSDLMKHEDHGTDQPSPTLATPGLVPSEEVGSLETIEDPFPVDTPMVRRLDDVDTSWWGARASDQQLGWTQGRGEGDRGDRSSWSATSTSDDDRDPDYGSDVSPSSLDIPWFGRLPAKEEAAPVDLDDLWKEIDALQVSHAQENALSQADASDDPATDLGSMNTMVEDGRMSFDLFSTEASHALDHQPGDQGSPLAPSLRVEPKASTVPEAPRSLDSGISQPVHHLDLAHGKDAHSSDRTTSLEDDQPNRPPAPPETADHVDSHGHDTGQSALVAALWEAGSDSPLELPKEALDRDIRSAFLDDAIDLLSELKLGFIDMERHLDDHDRAQETRRIIHTLKGAAASAGFFGIAGLCQAMENLFDGLADGRLSSTERLLTVFVACSERLNQMAASAQTYGSDHDNDGALAQLKLRLLTATAPIGNLATKPAPTHMEADFRLPGEPATAVASDSITDDSAPTLVRLEDSSEVEKPAHSGMVEKGRVDRVAMARLDALIDLVGEIVTNRSSLEQRLAHMRRAVNDLSSTTMRLRHLETSVRKMDETRAPSREEPNVDGEVDSRAMRQHIDLREVSQELQDMVADVAGVDRELRYLLGEFDTVSTGQARIAAEMHARLHQARLGKLESAPG